VPMMRPKQPIRWCAVYNTLREAELISVVKRGRERVYALERERLRDVLGDWLAWFTPGEIK
jgi:DNA-binding transcriptional ArsR family regulator